MSQPLPRIAKAAEPTAISAILGEAAAWMETHGFPLWRGPEIGLDEVSEQVAAGLFWIAFVGESAAGCVRFQLEDELFWPDVPRGESAFVHRLAVRRAFAGRGVSGALLDWSKARATELGRKYLRLDCEAHREPLCRLYESHGFRKHSERNVERYRVARYEWATNSAPAVGSS